MNVIHRKTFFGMFGSGAFSGKPPLYTGTDVEPLLAFSRTFFPKTVIEIGIQRGETAKCLLDNSPWIQNYVGIDVAPSHRTALPVQQSEVPKQPGELVKNDPRVRLIVKPNGSRDVTPAELPVADLIYIDGDHSKTGVLQDTELARKVIRKGGIICWHDYGNPAVPSVTKAIDFLNGKGGNAICLIEKGFLCFEFCRNGK
ncbi:class I SAM-dependent methyltransferase [Cohnella massiliensis]|uniref:class I SAM-dependent methyltransferase n=1 Tax=Cohnella massiliensis TaxID=1816691 RepID=UPI0009BB1A2E|nr:class I SAM-dependent methyltransferase [Cohnella massiliensis]